MINIRLNTLLNVLNIKKAMWKRLVIVTCQKKIINVVVTWK